MSSSVCYLYFISPVIDKRQLLCYAFEWDHTLLIFSLLTHPCHPSQLYA